LHHSHEAQQVVLPSPPCHRLGKQGTHLKTKIMPGKFQGGGLGCLGCLGYLGSAGQLHGQAAMIRSMMTQQLRTQQGFEGGGTVPNSRCDSHLLRTADLRARWGVTYGGLRVQRFANHLRGCVTLESGCACHPVELRLLEDHCLFLNPFHGSSSKKLGLKNTTSPFSLVFRPWPYSKIC
jgi:hypothetical protein